jgi:hypothetical protein
MSFGIFHNMHVGCHHHFCIVDHRSRRGDSTIGLLLHMARGLEPPGMSAQHQWRRQRQALLRSVSEFLKCSSRATRLATHNRAAAANADAVTAAERAMQELLVRSAHPACANTLLLPAIGGKCQQSARAVTAHVYLSWMSIIVSNVTSCIEWRKGLPLMLRH